MHIKRHGLLFDGVNFVNCIVIREVELYPFAKGAKLHWSIDHHCAHVTTG